MTLYAFMSCTKTGEISAKSTKLHKMTNENTTEVLKKKMKHSEAQTCRKPQLFCHVYLKSYFEITGTKQHKYCAAWVTRRSS